MIIRLAVATRQARFSGSSGQALDSNVVRSHPSMHRFAAPIGAATSILAESQWECI